MTKAAAVASSVGFNHRLLVLFVNATSRPALAQQMWFGTDTLVPSTWSLTWTVVDPLYALPLSLVMAILSC